MALVIEDGSLVAGANSYVTVEEVRAFANARTLPLPDADADVESACILSADYIRGIEYKFQGERISIDQVQTWPRYPVVIHGFDFPSNEIPQSLKDGCCQLAIDSSGGSVLQPTISGKSTVKEKVGDLEVEYSDNQVTDGKSVFSAAYGFLAPLFKTPYQSGGSGSGRTLRI